MTAIEPRLNLRLHIPLLFHAVFAQTTIGLVKINLSYRALELGWPKLWIGLIAATFAVVPIFIGLWVGRFIDRGHDALAVWIGSACTLIGCALFAFLPSTALNLLGANVVLGFGHMFFMAGSQIVCERSGAGGDRRDLAFGNYMVANAIGAGLGPMVLGLFGGTGAIPDTTLLFYVGFGGAILTMIVALMMRPAPARPKGAAQKKVLPLRELLRTPGLVMFIFASVMTITSHDLLNIYLPLLGTERQIDASQIGLALTLRAAATMVSRLLYTRTLALVGRMPLMVGSIFAGGLGMVLLGMPLDVIYVHIGCMFIGFALGYAATVTLTAVVSAAPVEGRATAVSLRIVGNRVGQVGFPILGGLVAMTLGAGGVFVATSLGLFAVATGIYAKRRNISR